MTWTVIVPMSPLDRAKTRLADASSSPSRHRALVRAMRRDTVRAIVQALDVARLVIVTGTPDAALADLSGLLPPEREAEDWIQLLADPASDPTHSGLNSAVAFAAGRAATDWPADGVAVVVADLPALTAAALDQVLAGAGLVDLGVVVDRQGMGTTMLTAAPGHALHPRFGPGSARRHVELGASRLSAPLPARTDVDVLDDLEAARRIGLGPAMTALLHAGELPLPPTGRRD
jgi:2-phospho-L-lactate/phosphoenolpyruvate guanylyltransferase